MRKNSLLLLVMLTVSAGALGAPADDAADEAQAAQLMSQSFAGLGCEQAGTALRRLSNRILGDVRFATTPNPFPPAPGDTRGRLQEQMRRKWLGHLRSPTFWNTVWQKLADQYRSCNLTCFDDGVAVGQISGVGYCSASIGVDGLTAPGFAYQPPLPLCQNATFVGCQSGYKQAASTYAGCGIYTENSYDLIFKQYQSQDCHID